MNFNEIDISSFRGIRQAHIEGLRLVNLFFGKNNCGKSSVLDAVFLISGLSNPKLPFNTTFSATTAGWARTTWP